jgi:hypothetical protein
MENPLSDKNLRGRGLACVGASSFGSSPLMSVNFQIAPLHLERERSCQAKETKTAQAAPAELLCES